jgi:hypothetical protein
MDAETCLHNRLERAIIADVTFWHCVDCGADFEITLLFWCPNSRPEEKC